jgi:hypothetical protein
MIEAIYYAFFYYFQASLNHRANACSCKCPTRSRPESVIVGPYLLHNGLDIYVRKPRIFEPPKELSKGKQKTNKQINKQTNK